MPACDSAKPSRSVSAKCMALLALWENKHLQFCGVVFCSFDFHIFVLMHILGWQSALVSGFASLGGFQGFWVFFSFMNPVCLRNVGQLCVSLLMVVPTSWMTSLEF